MKVAELQIKFIYSLSTCIHDVRSSLWESMFKVICMHCNTSEHVYLKSFTARRYANTSDDDVNQDELMKCSGLTARSTLYREALIESVNLLLLRCISHIPSPVFRHHTHV